MTRRRSFSVPERAPDAADRLLAVRARTGALRGARRRARRRPEKRPPAGSRPIASLLDFPSAPTLRSSCQSRRSSPMPRSHGLTAAAASPCTPAWAASPSARWSSSSAPAAKSNGRRPRGTGGGRSGDGPGRGPLPTPSGGARKPNRTGGANQAGKAARMGDDRRRGDRPGRSGRAP